MKQVGLIPIARLCMHTDSFSAMRERQYYHGACSQYALLLSYL